MNELNNLDKNLDKIRLDANDILYSSKGFCLFAITTDGDFKTINYCGNLNQAEFLGFQSYIREITSQIIDCKTELILPDSNQNNDENEEDDDLII